MVDPDVQDPMVLIPIHPSWDVLGPLGVLCSGPSKKGSKNGPKSGHFGGTDPRDHGFRDPGSIDLDLDV